MLATGRKESILAGEGRVSFLKNGQVLEASQKWLSPRRQLEMKYNDIDYENT
jgi:hypothetical protein